MPEPKLSLLGCVHQMPQPNPNSPSPDRLKDAETYDIEPHEFAAPAGVFAFEDLLPEAGSEINKERRSNDGAADVPGEDGMDLEGLDNDDAGG
ncbi:hypothetical protein PpBr36_07867 [Pyricularia pennisetigena]|uniref:hypothetical protein n=1 Tax=Pyricularia pennisetigena TaxID=1578925 RepID=UPI001150470D|nr:hypothetical protein PpBr36_07867 [Pyricularia pennisetigena]TLS26058.1 hypothetical protein PpBr36_07867 [Pyricularia pennisetigena]